MPTEVATTTLGALHSAASAGTPAAISASNRSTIANIGSPPGQGRYARDRVRSRGLCAPPREEGARDVRRSTTVVRPGADHLARFPSVWPADQVAPASVGNGLPEGPGVLGSCLTTSVGRPLGTSSGPASRAPSR